MIKSSKSGFTLAEVLTTLMVIGVVAAMTIPTLLNSTQNQQAKVACKKAASVLSQGIQLLVAQEVSCSFAKTTIADRSAELASCMKNALNGERSGNTITTSDGMVYTFYAPSGSANQDLEEVCGKEFTSWNGGGSCAVVVDTNGNSKGTGSAPATGNFTNSGFANDPQSGTDIIGFSLNTTGVRPLAYGGSANRGYEYIYGTKRFNPGTTKICLKNAVVAAEGVAAEEAAEINNCTKPENSFEIVGTYTLITGDSATCDSGYSSATIPTGKTLVESCTE